MMKKIINFFIVLLVLGVFVIGCTTPEVDLSRKGPSGQAGRSNVAHLYLYEKTGDPDWDIVVDGAWGKMKYNLSGETFDFVFNGHGLLPGVEYELIYYVDPFDQSQWATLHSIMCLGTGTANGGGNVHIAASVDTGDLPNPLVDPNADENLTTYTWDSSTGAKIWLVPKTDISCELGQFTAWNHEVEDNIYLFEEELINFDDTTPIGP
jgi:hypothetical protein